MALTMLWRRVRPLAAVGLGFGGVMVVELAVVLVRYRRVVRTQRFERVRSHEREMLARELHDTVAHHVSAIAVQAQAGRFLAGSRDLDGAAKALEVIEGEASRTLAEMRAVVGPLRRGNGAAASTTRGRRSRRRCTGSPGRRSPMRGATHGTRPGSTSSWTAAPPPCG